MRAYTSRLLVSALVSVTLVACGDDEEKKPACDPVENTGCAAGLVCEFVSGGGSVCADPVVVRGSVFDLGDDAAVEGARIVALDVNGAPLSSVAVSGEDGLYVLVVPHERTNDGAPVPLRLTLRADAAGYQTFPFGIRQALPLDTTGAVADEDLLVVESAVTSIGLIGLEEGAGTGSISGTVDLPVGRPGVLVVAEKDGRGVSGIADRDGNYRIFNLAAGSYAVTGYTRGASFDTATADVTADADVDVDLGQSDARTGTVAGKVSIVNPGAGQATSIVLVLESLFDETTLRGESPPGLRSPTPGRQPDVTGSFVIEGVPAGRYVVLAAFENDFLVRDPDTTIGGTQIVHQEVAPGADVVLAESFKVTGALNFLAPLGLEPLAVSAAPQISWEDDSSEDGYELVVYDALGDVAWTHTEPGHSGSDPSVTYGGPLEPGMYYQVKVRSMKSGTPISQTEDLAGVFFVD